MSQKHMSLQIKRHILNSRSIYLKQLIQTPSKWTLQTQMEFKPKKRVRSIAETMAMNAERYPPK